MKKQAISIFLALTMAVTGLPVFAVNNTDTETVSAMADGDISSELVSAADGCYVISEPGSYTIKDITPATANRIEITAAVCELTLENVNINTSSKAPSADSNAPIKINAGSSVTLHIEGTNTLTAPSLCAAVAVYENANLIIDGSGSLTAAGGQNAPAIGTDKSMSGYNTGSTNVSGNIVINSAKVTATGGANAPGIGAVAQAPGCGSIQINGGYITAKGGNNAPGIGGANQAVNGNILITGGYIKAEGGRNAAGIGYGYRASVAACAPVVIDGGSIDAAISDGLTVTDKAKSPIRHITVSGMDPDTDVTVGAWSAKTDASGKLYPYIKNTDTAFALSCSGVIYYTDEITADTDTYTLKTYTGDACSCTETDAHLEFTEDTPSIAEVNMLESSAGVKLSCAFTHAQTCTYPIHSSNAAYSVSIDGVGAADLSKYAALDTETGYLNVTYEAAVENMTVHVEASVVNNGVTFTASKDITVRADNSVRLDLSSGSVYVSAGSSADTMNIRHGERTYSDVPRLDSGNNPTKIHIVQSGSVTDNIISVSGGVDAYIVPENLNVKGYINQSVLQLGENVDLTLELKGENSLATSESGAAKPVISATSSASVTITGDGTLSSVSASGPGIGSIGTLTVNSGTLIATGGAGGAGIGGAKDGNGINVTVNGGRVIAKGSGTAAGIGGGEDGEGGTFTINGGYVKAQNGQAGGVGIGAGGNNMYHRNAYINAGSVDAVFAQTLMQGEKVLYEVTLSVEDTEGIEAFEYTVGDDETNKHPVFTDEEGLLHLFLTAGDQWIRLYSDNAVSHYKYMNVKYTDNTGECVKDGEAHVTDFFLAGQTEEKARIDDNTGVIRVKVPHNLLISKMKPAVEFTGHSVSPDLNSKNDNDSLNFTMAEDNQTASASFTVTGNDKRVKTYTVILEFDEDSGADTAQVVDISKGDITITDDYMEYGGIRYRLCEHGYIITGTTTSNTLSVDLTEKNVPLTFRDLNISSASLTAGPLSVSSMVDINISVEGENTLSSVNTSAVSFVAYDAYNVNITGSGKLSIHGDDNTVAIDENVRLSVKGVHTAITAGMGHNALSGSGSFVTDSVTNMRVDMLNPSSPNAIAPKNDEGTLLYQLKLKLESIGTLPEECVFNSVTYKLDSDHAFYLMLPDGEYPDLRAEHDSDSYTGSASIAGAAQEAILSSVTVTSVNFDNSTLPYTGGKVTFTVEGDMLQGNVSIVLDPDKDGAPDISAPVTEQDGQYIAVIDVPFNQSEETPVFYTVYYVIKGEKFSLPDGKNKISVNINTAVCRIDSVSIEGQIGDASRHEMNDYKYFLAYMPFDFLDKDNNHSTGTFFKITDIRAVGTVADRGDTYFYRRVSGSSEYYEKDDVKVTSKDNSTYDTYGIRVRLQKTPTINSLSFRSSLTSNGGDVEITASGDSLANLLNARYSENRIVTIYAQEDEIEPAQAQYSVLPNGQHVYKATLSFPKNTSTTEANYYHLMVKIGDTVQDINSQNAVVAVPRQQRGVAGIIGFELTGQVGNSLITQEDGKNIIRAVMPFDADLSALIPIVDLEDGASSYEPTAETDFTGSDTTPVKFTVTSENGENTNEYFVYVSKEAEPEVTGVDFKNPQYSSAGRVPVTVLGNNLANIANALDTSSVINVSLVPSDGSGNTISATAYQKENGDFIAELNVPKNDTLNPVSYTVTVTVADKLQSIGSHTLTVPGKEPNEKELTDIILAPGQSTITIEDNRVYLYVPYNTDLSNITPQISFSGDKCTPEGPQDFNSTVTYYVIAKDGTYKAYDIHAIRSGSPAVPASGVKINKTAAMFNDTSGFEVDITGSFIPFLKPGEAKDTLTVQAMPQDGSQAIDARVVFDPDVYGGHAAAYFDLPVNNTTSAALYSLRILVNGKEQTIGAAGNIYVPGRRTRTITDFRINGQLGKTIITEKGDNDSTIEVALPYDTDLRSIEPFVLIDGDSYTPTGPQDFSGSDPVVYTVLAKDDTPRKYRVSAKRASTPSLGSVNIQDTGSSMYTFSSFRAGAIKADIDGVFFDDVKVRVKRSDGTYLDDSCASVAMDGWHSAQAMINIPANTSFTDAQQYTLEFYLDGFTDPARNPSAVQLTVPRRKTRNISGFTVQNQSSQTRIEDNDIYIEVNYDTDLRSISPSVTYDGDSITPSDAVVSFDNETKSVVYTVSAADDEDISYTVHISRTGSPSVSSAAFKDPSDYRGGTVIMSVSGVFFDSFEVYASPQSGTPIKGTVSFDPDKPGEAVAALDIPANNNTEQSMVYSLRFVADGLTVPFDGKSEITVPRMRQNILTEFEFMPDNEFVTSQIQDTDIYVEVPYYLDISAVEPQMQSAASISPSGPQDFSDTEKNVKYTLSSPGNPDTVYTVHISRIGQEPRLVSMTAGEKQAADTVYDGDNVSIMMKSGTNLKELEPVLEFEGDDYTPKGPQNFTGSDKNPVVYTITNRFGISHTYYVTINKKRSNNGGSKPKPSPSPQVTQTPAPTPVPEDTPTPQPTKEPKRLMPYMSGYDEDGISLFKPEKTLTRGEMARILAALDTDFDETKTYEQSFTDVDEGTWYASYIGFAAQKGYVSGYEDNTYRPESMITRAEIAAIAARYISAADIQGEDRFTDIYDLYWCRDQINALAAMMVVQGFEDGSYRPYENVTRAQTAAIMNRATARNADTDTKPCPYSDVFPDHWAYSDILRASLEL